VRRELICLLLWCLFTLLYGCNFSLVIVKFWGELVVLSFLRASAIIVFGWFLEGWTEGIIWIIVISHLSSIVKRWSLHLTHASEHSCMLRAGSLEMCEAGCTLRFNNGGIFLFQLLEWGANRTRTWSVDWFLHKMVRWSILTAAYNLVFVVIRDLVKF